MKRKFLSSFYSFISGPGKYVLFTCLFYTLWLVMSMVSNQNFELDSFPQRMIGIATFEAYDVSARVSLFYKSIGLLLFAFTFFNLLAYFLYLKNTALIYSTEAKIFNYSSLIGIFFFVFQVFDYDVSYTMELVYYIHKLMLLTLFLRLVFFKKSDPTIYTYTFVIVLTFFLYFFIADCLEFSGSLNNPDFYIITFITSALLILLVLFLSQKENSLIQQTKLNKLIYVSLPLGFLPIISAAKDEVFFILKNNGIFLTDALLPFIILITLLLGLIFYRRNKINKLHSISQKELITFRYFPLLIFSLITYTYYNHYFNYSGESFESANKYLAIMEFKLFGVIPTLEKFNSHLLSDYFFSAIYTFLNGMGTGNDMELYDFLFIPFSFTLYYFLIYFITRNAYIALFTILLFPFYTSMLPGGYSFSIPGIFALHFILTQQQTLKNYLILFLSVVAMVLWRFDLGYSCMLIIPAILLAYNFLSPNFKINWPVLLKALALVLSLLLLFIGALSFYRDVNLFAKSLYILNYFASAQTYGYTTIGWENMPSYKMHYFIFPALVGIIIIALLLKFKSLTVSKKQRPAYLSLLFICGYYIVNFNRGLVRHSLIEWTDDFTASFIYVILSGSVFVFFHKQNTVLKFILFLAISFYSILSFKLPVTKGSISMMEMSLTKIQTIEHEDLLKIRVRTKGLPSPEENTDKDFLDFIKKNTKAEETFIDFTGSSLLYYYTKKITPSYFFQNPLCNHNEFLQKHFIDDLANYKTPYLLFSSVNENDYDVVDGVPNTLRNYRMAEYFYRNYEPHVILGHLRIWKKKGLQDLSKIDTLFNYTKKNGSPNSMDQITTHINFKKDKKYLLRIDMNGETSAQIKILYKRDTILPILYKASRRVSYSILDTIGQGADLFIKNDSDSCNSVTILECDYVPDFYSEKYLIYNFKKLPYIWGTFDKEVYKEDLLFEKNINTVVKKDKPSIISIPEKLDRSTGNTVIFTCKYSGKKIQTLTLSFGNKDQKDRSHISFTVIPSAKEENYAIRLSSIYKWYTADINQLSLSNDTDKPITLLKMRVTKGL